VDYSYGKLQRGFQGIHAENGIHERHVMLFISTGYIDGVRVIFIESRSGTGFAYKSFRYEDIDSNLN
jgi:hypothetical protein